MADVLCTSLISSALVWINGEKAWTNSQKLKNGLNHYRGLVFEPCSRSAKLFSVLNYIGWKFWQSPTYPPSTGSDTWTPEIDTRCCLGARKAVFVKTKVWFLSRVDFEHTVWASWICTPFWPEVAHLTGSCEKHGRRVQDFITFSRLWRLYVSVMFWVLLNVVLESHLEVPRVVSIIFQTSSTKSIETCTEVTKNKSLLFRNWLKPEVMFLLGMISKDQPYMKTLVLTFLQRLMRCTFNKVLKSFEKIQVFSRIDQIFGFTRIAPMPLKALWETSVCSENL